MNLPAVGYLPWLLSLGIPSIFASSAIAAGSSLLLLCGFAMGSTFVIDGAMLTGIGSLIGILVGALATWRNQAIAMEKLRAEAHDRDQERVYRSEKEEMDRKERMHNLAGHVNELKLRLEQKDIELLRTNAELDDLRRNVAGLDTRSSANRADIDTSMTAIKVIQDKADSGHFPPVKLPANQGPGQS